MHSFGYKAKKLTASKPDLFDDCVYFCPAAQTATVRAKHQTFWSHFFLNPVIDNEASNGAGMVPASARFYLDTAHIVSNIDNYLVSDTFPNSLVDDYLHPFYFRKYEVTNKEYREFVNWVTDSIARTPLGYRLPDGSLDRKKKYDLYDSATDAITQLILPKPKRFFSRKQIDASKIIYAFKQKPAECPFTEIPIYPDTLSWLHDFSYSFNEPMTNMYHWHPAYDQYPVCGVTYWQCLAFLEWKTMQLTKLLNNKYKVSCELPGEIEWDYVNSAISTGEGFQLMGGQYHGTADATWLTDLMLSGDSAYRHKLYSPEGFTEKDSSSFDHVLTPGASQSEINKRKPLRFYNEQYSNPLRTFALYNERTWGDFVVDGYFHTGPAKILPNGFEYKNAGSKSNERSRAHYDEVTGICWLDGNVSEWMREDLDENWRGVFSKHMVVLDGPYAEEHRQLRAYEKYYYDQLPAHGKLVRGCNWYDERFAMKYGKNVEGIQAKTFCDPDKAHCTLGFRYVIYVEPGN